MNPAGSGAEQLFCYSFPQQLEAVILSCDESVCMCAFLPQAVRTASVLECCVKEGTYIVCVLGVWDWCVYDRNSFITVETAARGDGSWSLGFLHSPERDLL
ncbi:hypothetical protein QQF64_012616 [Cirrhinus molitorella]|uniref:Uncharacterized protein n=1 Tax=Cirrhinus molitorella TaxID=172907 RepID=A0ABR3LYG3_9TELE